MITSISITISSNYKTMTITIIELLFIHLWNIFGIYFYTLKYIIELFVYNDYTENDNIRSYCFIYIHTYTYYNNILELKLFKPY